MAKSVACLKRCLLKNRNTGVVWSFRTHRTKYKKPGTLVFEFLAFGFSACSQEALGLVFHYREIQHRLFLL